MRAPVAAAILVLTGACGGSSPASSLTGFGATIAAWNNAHTQAASYAGLPAYGPVVSTPQGRIPQYSEVQLESGRVSQYLEVLPNGTSLATAEKAARANLPSSAVAKSFVVTTSCAFWNFTSTIVNDAMGSPQVTVEIAYDDASGSPYWMPNNVNTLTFQTGKGSSSDVC
ncbi:MAG TPA: hypothetical protein VII76_07805 [Acidimicrobiales bacterium]